MSASEPVQSQLRTCSRLRRPRRDRNSSNSVTPRRLTAESLRRGRRCTTMRPSVEFHGEPNVDAADRRQREPGGLDDHARSARPVARAHGGGRVRGCGRSNGGRVSPIDSITSANPDACSLHRSRSSSTQSVTVAFDLRCGPRLAGRTLHSAGEGIVGDAGHVREHVTRRPLRRARNARAPSRRRTASERTRSNDACGRAIAARRFRASRP